MFIGHYAVAFGAKRAAPRTSLGMLVLAAQLADLIWPVLVLLGVEEVRVVRGTNPFLYLDFVRYPITHSLVAIVGWGLVLGALYYAARRYARGAVVLGLVVVSHWLLDWLTHRPDLPLWPGGPRVGLGLWVHPVATVIVELAMLVIGLWLYVRTTRARDAIGRWSLVTLVLLLLLIYASSFFGPPPPSARAVAAVGLAGWILPVWGWWIDRHRGERVAV